MSILTHHRGSGDRTWVIRLVRHIASPGFAGMGVVFCWFVFRVFVCVCVLFCFVVLRLGLSHYVVGCESSLLTWLALNMDVSPSSTS